MGEAGGYYTRAELKARGWPSDLIARLLGPPDRLMSPRKPGLEREKCYEAGRVEGMERTAAFREEVERVAANRARKGRAGPRSRTDAPGGEA